MKGKGAIISKAKESKKPKKAVKFINLNHDIFDSDKVSQDSINIMPALNATYETLAKNPKIAAQLERNTDILKNYFKHISSDLTQSGNALNQMGYDMPIDFILSSYMLKKASGSNDIFIDVEEGDKMGKVIKAAFAVQLRKKKDPTEDDVIEASHKLSKIFLDGLKGKAETTYDLLRIDKYNQLSNKKYIDKIKSNDKSFNIPKIEEKEEPEAEAGPSEPRRRTGKEQAEKLPPSSGVIKPSAPIVLPEENTLNPEEFMGAEELEALKKTKEGGKKRRGRPRKAAKYQI